MKKSIEINYKSLLDSYLKDNLNMVILIDDNKNIINFSKNAADWTKKHFKKKLVKNLPVEDFIKIPDYSEFDKTIISILDKEENVLPMISILFDNKNNEYWYEYTFRLIESKDNKNYVIIYINNITETKKTIDTLAKSERRFKSLVKNSSDIILVITTKGIIEYISNSIESFLGYTNKECINQPFIDFLFEDDKSAYKMFLANLKKNENGTYSSEFQVKSKNEGLLYFEIAGNNQLANPSIKGFVLNARDITERKYMDKMVGRIFRQNELILDTVTEGIFGINIKGLITFINPYAAKILKYKQEELISISYKDLFSDEEINTASLIESSLLNGKTYTFINSTFKTSENNLFPVEYSSSPIIENDKIIGAVITFNDRTEQKMFQNQLRAAKIEAEKANVAKGEFLAHMSHEIRTPMNSIMGFLELLLFTSINDTQREYINIISESAKHLLTLLNDILDFSKIEKGKIELENIIFNPYESFISTVKLFSARADKLKIKLSSKIDKGIPFCCGDPFRIKQVMTNLISNAIKFTSEGGSIVVKIKKTIDQNKCDLDFSVKDSGIGIPKEKQQQIFESFTQTNSSDSRIYGGTGLGLSISSLLVQMMGGQLKIKSTPGKGSTFYFKLSFEISDSPPDNVETEEIVDPNNIDSIFTENNLNILVAEDSANNQKLMTLMLNKLGVSFDIAENGLIAFEDFKSKKYNLIFMDGNMPLCDGVEATQMIREFEEENKLKPIPIIALSAKAIKGDKENFIKSGMNDYLSKPVSIISLYKTIKNYCTIKTNLSPKLTTKEMQEQQEKQTTINFEELETHLGLDSEMILELLKDFLLSLDNYLNKLKESIEKNTYADIENAAHKLKGTAATYKFDDLSKLCKQMEDAANNETSIDYKEMFFKINNEASKLKKLLETL